MLTVQEVRERLRDMNLSAVARSTGVSYFKLVNITTSMNYDPKYSVMRKLDDYLKNNTMPEG